MPYVVGLLLIIGSIAHILETGGDWMDVAWLTVGIGGIVACLVVDIYFSRSKWPPAPPAPAQDGGER